MRKPPLQIKFKPKPEPLEQWKRWAEVRVHLAGREFDRIVRDIVDRDKAEFRAEQKRARLALAYSGGYTAFKTAIDALRDRDHMADRDRQHNRSRELDAMRGDFKVYGDD
jgi:hypothetical protein